MQNLNIKTNWNLSPIYCTDKRFKEKREEWQAKAHEFVIKWKGREDFIKNPSVMKEALDDYEKFNRFYGIFSDEGYYYSLRRDREQADNEIKAKFNDIEEFGKKIENDLKFFELSLAKIPPEKHNLFLKDISLKEYKHFLEKIFKSSRYMLNEKEEIIMNLKSSTSFSKWVNMLSEFLSKEEMKVLDEEGKIASKSFSEVAGLLSNKNKAVRDKAAESFNSLLKKYLEVAEAEINAVVADKKVNDEIREMPRPDFSRHLSDDIESEIVDLVIETVTKRFDISRRFYKLKAKILGFDKLQYHERNLEVGELSKKYSFEEAVHLINRVFTKIDDGFSEIFRGFVENGNIDAYPKKGKRQGAFCNYGLLTQPTYILLNHNGELNDILTIAHEAGHGINDELMKQKQNSLNFGTPISTAEVASTFFEDFVLEELMKDADDELKLVLMMQKLNDNVNSIFRQVACYNFEKELHSRFREKKFLSKEEIGSIFQKNMEDYMGEFIEQSEGSENWWVHWSHIRMYFYVYSYSSGLLISKYLQNLVKEDPKNVLKVKEFLSAGLSGSPKDIFAKLGIDISDRKFWESGLDEVEKLLENTEKLAKKMGKI